MAFLPVIGSDDVRYLIPVGSVEGVDVFTKSFLISFRVKSDVEGYQVFKFGFNSYAACKFLVKQFKNLGGKCKINYLKK